jgi:hypothetical protein
VTLYHARWLAEKWWDGLTTTERTTCRAAALVVALCALDVACRALPLGVL